MEQFPVTFVILNGKGAENDILRSAVNVMRDEGYTLHIRVTWEKGDAIRYVEEASRMGADTVVAGGGDGTINEVATALAKLAPEQRPVLGILPSAQRTILPPVSAFLRSWTKRYSWR